MIVLLPRARRLLVVAPHPDDEAIAAWGLVRRLLREGARVAVVVVSDGGASHPGSSRWPRRRLVAERRRETLRAMRALGVAPPAITFLDLPDGGLQGCAQVLRERLARAIRRRPAPDLVVGPDGRDDHADHRAVAIALASLRRAGERRLSYHVWPAGTGRAGPAHGTILKGAELDMKRRIIRSYRTQGGSITDAPSGFTLTHRHLRAFAGPQERYAVAA